MDNENRILDYDKILPVPECYKNTSKFFNEDIFYMAAEMSMEELDIEGRCLNKEDVTKIFDRYGNKKPITRKALEDALIRYSKNYKQICIVKDKLGDTFYDIAKDALIGIAHEGVVNDYTWKMGERGTYESKFNITADFEEQTIVWESDGIMPERMTDAISNMGIDGKYQFGFKEN